MITCPKNEQMWWLYKNKSGTPIFLMTSKKNNRDYYYLYEVLPGDELKKLGRAKTPPELEERFDVDRKMFES